MTTKSIIWNQLKALGYESKKLKADYEVSYQQASLSLLEDILGGLEFIKEILENEVGQGVTESLGSQCGGSLQPNPSVTNTKDQEYKLFLPEVIPAIVEKLDDNNTYKVDRGSGHTPVVYHLCIDNKDGQTKLLVIIGSYLALSTIQMYYRDNLISKAIKPEITEDNVATVTSNNIYYILVHSQSDEVYITTPYCLNAKRLIDCKDKELKNSLYASQDVAADEAQEWLRDNYQVVTVDYNNIRLDIKAYFRDRVLVSQLNCYLPRDEASTKGYYYKGIPIEHFNFKHEAYIDSVLKDTSGVLISKYLGTHAISFNDGEQRKSDITLLEAVKLAKQWLGVKQQQVPSTEEDIQPSNLERQQIIEEYHKYRKQRQAIKRTLHRLELKSIYGYSPI